MIMHFQREDIGLVMGFGLHLKRGDLSLHRVTDYQTRTQMASVAAENIIAHATGQRPPNIVNPEVLG